MEQQESLQHDPLDPAKPVDPARNGNLPPSDSGKGGPEANGDGHHDVPPIKEPSWLAQNAFALVVVLLILGMFIYFKANLWWIAKAGIGLSLVIFIHELGHFLVAKWCDVHVTAFSIGFGPPIPGCTFQWGETTYKLAVFPLGGYVQMVGQVDGDESSDGSEDDPRSYRNKGVFQRMAIISAGVIMNVILAIVCFVIVFLGPGKERNAPVINNIDPESPAFRAGLRTSDEIVQIGSTEHPYFSDLQRNVMGTTGGQVLLLVTRQPGGEPMRHEIVPRKSKSDLAPMVGISSAQRLQLNDFPTPKLPTPTIRLSPAAEASAPFKFGDWIVATSDPDHPGQIKDLPFDPRCPDAGQPGYPGWKQRDYFEFQKRMQRLADKEVTIVVEREDAKGEKKKVDIRVPVAYHWSLGIVMHMGQITAIRAGSPADDAKIQVRDKEKNIDGDVIVQVSYDDANGKKIVLKDALLDPLRLPDLLRADMAKITAPEKKKVTLQLKRIRNGPIQTVEETLLWDDTRTFDRIVPLSMLSPWAIPELGFAYVVKATVGHVDAEGSPFKSWDEIKALKVVLQKAADDTAEPRWAELESDEQWANAYYGIFMYGGEGPPPIQGVKFKVNRKNEATGNNEITEIEVVPQVDKTWPMINRGWILMPDVRRQKADGIVEAAEFGFKDTGNYMVQVFQTIRGMFTNRLSYKNLAGIGTIAWAAYKYAGMDLGELIFFLGLISVNLAVINFLPIPVLDGGHMVFLFYEKIRGEPASEAVRAAATYIGLALILGLMALVLYLDYMRFFG